MLFEFDENKKIDVIPLGRIAVDLNPVKDEHFKPLDKVFSFEKYIGGSPANIAVGLARLGIKTGFLGKVSNDQLGTYAIEYLNSQGIDVSHVSRTSGNETLGLAFTEILSETESSILMYRHNAADLCLTSDDINKDYIAASKILLISGTALAQSPSREAAFKAMMIAKDVNTKIVFDIDYRPHTWKSLDEITTYYSLAAERSDLILGSREEFDLTERFLSEKPENDRKSAEYWFGKGAKGVIIKHGKEGSNAYFSNGESYLVKPFPVKFLKGFGGGDGYASAFIAGVLRGKTLKQALSEGSASAAMLVSAKACSESMPTRDELENFEGGAVEKHGEMVFVLD